MAGGSRAWIECCRARRHTVVVGTASVDITGDDEIYDLGEALKGVIAAFNTILFDAIEDEAPAVDYEPVNTPFQDVEAS